MLPKGCGGSLPDVVILPLSLQTVSAAHAVEASSLETPWSENDIAAFIGKTDRYYFTAVCGSEVLGTAGFYEVAGECMIDNIAVQAAARRRGIGGMLLDAMLKKAESDGCNISTLEVSETNEAAKALYESRGFAVCGRRKNYYKSGDALLMEKNLI
jgi:ribosomal-protein-alanine N-acetyltransferase